MEYFNALDGAIPSVKDLRKRQGRTVKRMTELARVSHERLLTPAEKDELAKLKRDSEAIDVDIQSRKNTERKKADKVQGVPGEAIKPGQMRVWYERAVENRVLPSQGTYRDMNRYFGERMGFAKPGIETRTLLEDTAGSGQALSPTQYLADVIDVLLPLTLIGRLGFNVVPMDREIVQMPVYTSTYAGPTWIAENGSLSLDAGPAFAPLQLLAPGGFKFYTAVSLELAQDAFLHGGLDRWLAEAAARKMAVALDTAMILGVTANNGIPGLNGETGFVVRKQTGDTGTTGLAPTATTELGVIAEASVKKNIGVNELAFVSNVGAHEAYERIPIASFGRYFDDPPLVAKTSWYTSENSALAYTETDPAAGTNPAQTGGTFSSLYCGPWSRFGYLGVRMDLNASMMRLDQRLIDQGEIGYFSMWRGSIRFAHPETFTRTYGIITV